MNITSLFSNQRRWSLGLVTAVLLGGSLFGASDLTSEDAEEYYRKAVAFYEGNAVEQDFNQAARLAKEAAKAGHARAQVFFGYLHGRGLGARYSWSRAAYWWGLAADQDNLNAIYNLSTMYWFGIGVREDIVKARLLIERVVEPVNKVTDSMEDFVHFEEIQTECVWRLGLIYENGYGVEADNAKAAKFFERAAVAGHYQAMLKTALNYAIGEVFEPDNDKANLYLNMAMSQPSEFSQMEVKSFYLEGIEREDKYGEELKEMRERHRRNLAYLQSTCGKTLFEKSDQDGEDLFDKARHWLSLAVEADQLPAKTYLGLQYLLGLGVEKDLEKAGLLMRDAAKSGISFAEYYYAVMLYQGLGVEKDQDQAVLYFQRAEEGLLYAAIKAAENPGAAIIQTPAKLVAATREAAADDLTAKACLGRALATGFGLKRDVKRGLEILEECAATGNPVGQYALARTLHLSGKHRDPDRRTLNLFERAAEQGHLWAKYNAGLRLYLEGKGALFNRYRDALAYLQDCIEAGIADAKFILALMYLNGRGVDQNAKKAEELLLVAHQEGVELAKSSLGYLYYNGSQPVSRDYVKSRRYYELAAEDGDAEANFYLGGMYAEGRGVEYDFQQAAVYYRAAARSGHAEAAFRLGMLFKEGKEVALNYDIAAYWLQVAASKSHPLAFYCYSEMMEFGWGVEKNEKAAYENYRTPALQNATQLAYLGKARCELFRKGGAPRKYSSIVRSLKRVLEIDEATASAYLGVCYNKWAHSKKELNESYMKKSHEFFDRSVELNSPVGMTELAKMHMAKRVKNSSTKKAMELLTRAADLRYPEAAFLLAKAFADGIEGAPNAEDCIEYLNIAVDGQIEGAEDLLRQLEEESGVDKPIPIYDGAPA